MGVNFIAAKNSSSTGRTGNSAKKEKTPAKGASSLLSSIRCTNSQSAASVVAEKTSVHTDPTICKIRAPQKKNERTTGRRERRRTVGFLGFHMLEGSTRTWILPL